MGTRKFSKLSIAAAIGLTFLVIDQIYTNTRDYVYVPRNLLASDEPSVENRVKSYSSPDSIAAVMNTAKMGTGGLMKTFASSWLCSSAPSVKYIEVNQCRDDRHIIRTHKFDAGLEDIQKYRAKHTEGKCLITTAIRSPASWFGSMYLQTGKRNWKPREEMLQDYKKFLAAGDFHNMYTVLPQLLKEFNAGTLIQQAKIMDDNGGYSLIPAPNESTLEGCDLLFLRMEQSDQWSDIFKMLDPDITSKMGDSRLELHPDNFDQINAISSYELTSEEKINIYNSQDKFIQDWFDAYGYMDDVINNNIEDKNVSKVKLTAVINTPKMGTGGLFLTLTEDQECHDLEPTVKGLLMYDCKNDRKALRTHLFDVGSKEIQEQRKEEPDGQCLIITAIRSPATWFASKFLQSLGGCNVDEWPTEEELLRSFKAFTQRRSSYVSLHGALPDLLNEFKGGSLREQFKIMDENGGYSMLGPAPQDSAVAGCNLLFLRMEQSDQWPAIFDKVDATIEFKRGASRVDECPEFTEYIKVVADYDMTLQEKKTIYNQGSEFMKDWFDSYDYMNDDVEISLASA